MESRRRMGRPWRAALVTMALAIPAGLGFGMAETGTAESHGPSLESEVAQTAGERARERRRAEEEVRRRDRLRERRREREEEIRERREEWREERQLRIEEDRETEELRAREERELRRLRIESELDRRRGQRGAAWSPGRIGAERRALLGRFPEGWVQGILEGRVEMGWTPAAVRESRGEPRRITLTPGGDPVWHYEDLTIGFKNGLVSEAVPDSGADAD